ncbi:MAG: flagellar biosynthetic protein FliR [Gemmatimonadales bacterium]
MNPPGLLQLIGLQDWPTFVLISARVSGLFFAAPLWSMTELPKSVRGALAVLLSVILLPVVARPPALPDDMLAMSMILAGETLLGIAIGLTGALLMHGIVLAGEVASMQMGLSLGQALGSLPEGATVGVGQLKGYFAMLIYLSVGGHLMLYQGLAESFNTVAPGRAWEGMAGGQVIVNMAGMIFTTAVQAAAPIIVALILTNLALAIVGKAVPQLNVMMLSFPITISVGLIALGASLPFVATYFTGKVEGLPGMVTQTVDAFSPAVR